MNEGRCSHWNGTAGRYCHQTDHVRPYLQGPRCPVHTPAALAGLPEPDSTPLGAVVIDLAAERRRRRS
ncbi:hypothetical protein ACN261_05360 [Micromonospora sp. WMMD723]|uniref:hypothetical protein n=1 Tax=Micromonospora sp. WMMD723 TaxID=3403465 RepID=UPI003CF8AA5E